MNTFPRAFLDILGFFFQHSKGGVGLLLLTVTALFKNRDHNQGTLKNLWKS